MSDLSVSGFSDLFFSDNSDKVYLDRIAKNVTRIRGTDVNYFRLQDVTQRIDGDKPISDSEDDVPPLSDLGPFDGKTHSGNVNIYGEPIVVLDRLDSQIRESVPAWDYADPIHTRGIVMELNSDEDPDERGSVYVRTARLDLARVLMDELSIVCRRGDVVELPKLLRGYYDIVDVDRDTDRFGATGFFITYKLTLTKSSKFQPQRKELPPGDPL